MAGLVEIGISAVPREADRRGKGKIEAPPAPISLQTRKPRGARGEPRRRKIREGPSDFWPKKSGENFQQLFLGFPPASRRERPYIMKTPADGWFDASDPRQHLYHYTNQEGALGILRTGEIWASKFTFLNDISEFTHGVRVALGVVGSFERSGSFGPFAGGVRDALAEEFKRAERRNVCICSWSDQPDKLSMWRGYSSGSDQGYALGFPRAALAELSDREGFRLRPCIYDDQEQKNTLRDVVREWITSQPPPIASGISLSSAQIDNLAWAIFNEVPFLKHSAFAEEREWRMVSPSIGYPDPRYLARAGKRGPIPYFAFPLHKIRSNISLFLGPGEKNRQAAEGLKTILGKRDSRFRWETTRFSDIPFRD